MVHSFGSPSFGSTQNLSSRLFGGHSFDLLKQFRSLTIIDRSAIIGIDQAEIPYLGPLV